MTHGERYHGFDTLRAAMMILGVALHSATAYATYPDVWWLKDTTTSRWADLFILTLHTFRLPAFFVMSGFFAALVVERRGAMGFLENRAARLGLPFLLGMAAMYPYLKLASVYCHYLPKTGDAWGAMWGWVGRGGLERELEPMHLWFLQVLLWLSLGGAALGPRLKRWLGGEWFGRLMGAWWAPFVLAVPTGATLLPMKLGILGTPQSFMPHFQIVGAYAVFFVFGWGLFVHRERLGRLDRAWGPYLLGGVGAAWLAMGAVERLVAGFSWGAQVGSAGLNGLAAWLFIFGLLGLVLRHGNRPSARGRYLADSAYWLYLMHPVVLVAVQIPMLGVGWPVAVKIVVGFVVAVPVLLLSYEWGVRRSWVGMVLNGRRMERGGESLIRWQRLCA